MDIRLKCRRLLEDLFRSENGLQTYTLYRRYGIEPEEMLKIFDVYKSQEVISVDNDMRITLTDYGRGSIDRILGEIQSVWHVDASTYLDRNRLDIIMPITEPYCSPNAIKYLKNTSSEQSYTRD